MWIGHPALLSLYAISVFSDPGVIPSEAKTAKEDPEKKKKIDELIVHLAENGGWWTGGGVS